MGDFNKSDMNTSLQWCCDTVSYPGAKVGNCRQIHVFVIILSPEPQPLDNKFR